MRPLEAKIEYREVAYRAWEAAEAAWSLALHRRFGRDASEMRYRAIGKGEPGSELRQLHEACVAAEAAWRALPS